MKTDACSEESFVRHLVSGAHPLLRSWVGDEQLRLAFSREIREQIDRTHDERFAAEFQRHCPVEGVDVTRYKQRYFQIGGDNGAIAGIRFKGGNLAQPFVDVLTNYPVRTNPELSSLAELLRQEFREFAPRALRIWLFAHEPAEFLQLPAVRCDQRIPARPVVEIQALETPQRYELVDLRRPEGSAFYAKYEAVFREFVGEFPRLGAELHLETRESLSACEKEGSLYEVFVNGDWAGLIAARESSLFGLTGFEVIEEILARNFRGRGFAPAVQRRLVDTLDGHDNCLIFGTIHSSNQASFRTALRTGRIEILANYFVDIAFPSDRKSLEGF